MKYFVYCRKSTEQDERQVLSIPAQLRACEKIVENQGLRVVDVLKESKSARVPDKSSKFSLLLERIKAEEASGIVCWKLHRLSRNPKEAGIIMQLLTDGVIKEIITPERIINSKNCNDIVLGVEFGQASQYSKDLSKDIKKGLREKIAQGRYPGRAVPFYKTVDDGLGKNIAPDEKTSKYFEEWVDFIIKTRASLSEAAEWLESKGVKNRNGNFYKKSSIHRILQNPVYCGVIKYGDYPQKNGSWDPLISKRKFRVLQDVLGERRKPRNYSHKKGYRGLFICAECGCAITCTHKIKNGKDYIYYHCTKRRGNCNQPYVKEKDLEDQIFSHISRIQIDQEELDNILDMIRDRHGEEVANFEQRKRQNAKQLNEVEKMQSELVDMRLKRLIEQEVYEQKKEELDAKWRKLKELDEDYEFDRENWFKNLESFFNKCFKIEQVFNEGTIDERARMVRAIGKNLTMEDGMIGWNYRKPWDSMIIDEIEPDASKWWT
jgi:DNA invertase Pin-like site-specific DNA recombinase